MWCVRIAFCFLLLLGAASVLAGDSVEDSLTMPVFRPDGTPVERWRIDGDFNLDGIDDLLLSEDISKANDNGLYLAIYLRDSTGALSYYDMIFDSPRHLCIEKCEGEVRLWNYEYVRSGIGLLTFSVISAAGIIPGGKIELKESGVIDFALRQVVLQSASNRFKVQRSKVIAGKVQWYDDKQPLGMVGK